MVVRTSDAQMLSIRPAIAARTIAIEAARTWLNHWSNTFWSHVAKNGWPKRWFLYIEKMPSFMIRFVATAPSAATINPASPGCMLRIANCAANDAAAEERPQLTPLLVARHSSLRRNTRSPRKEPNPTPNRTSWGCQSRAATIVTLLVVKISPPVGFGRGWTKPVAAKITVNPAATTSRWYGNPHATAARYARVMIMMSTW